MFFGPVEIDAGHRKSVSGLAAIVKTVNALHKRLIPPNLNYEKPDPRTSLAPWKVQVLRILVPCHDNRTLGASINSFRYGGAKLHLIIKGTPNIYIDGTTDTDDTIGSNKEEASLSLYLHSGPRYRHYYNIIRYLSSLPCILSPKMGIPGPNPKTTKAVDQKLTGIVRPDNVKSVYA